MTEKWQAALKAVTTIGVPSVVSLYLIYFLTQSFNKDLDLIKTTQAAQVIQNATIVNANNDTKSKLEQVNKTLLAICANTAKNQAERNACFQ